MDALEWMAAVRDEIVALPNTMVSFRTGVERLAKITERLDKATTGIELVEQHLEASGALDAARVLNETVVGMERQVAAVQKSAARMPGADIMGGAVTDLQRGVSELARWVSGPQSEEPPQSS